MGRGWWRRWSLFASALALGMALFGAPALAAEPDPSLAADIAVTGGSAHGKLGSNVSIPLTRRNNGPADPVQGNITFELKVPGAVELLKDPTSPACTIVVPKRHYRCLNTNFMMVGHLYRESALVKVVSTSTTPGFVAVSYKHDPKTSNNRATLTVKVDGVPKPKPTTAPTTKAAPKPGATKSTATKSSSAPTSAAASSSPSPSQSPDVVVDEGLTPAAASDTLPLVASVVGAGVLAAVGVFGIVLWRRRRDDGGEPGTG